MSRWLRRNRVRAAALAMLAVLLAACSAGERADAATSSETAIVAPENYTEEGKAHYAERVAFFAGRETPEGAVALVGDSLTEWGDWDALLPGVTTVNYGISRDRAEGVLARLSQVQATKPSRMVLLIGTNDLGAGYAPAEIAATTREIVAAAKKFLPAGRILLQSVMPREAMLKAEVEELNARLAKIAAEEGVDFLDLYAPFLAGDGLDPAVADDQLHLNDAGYSRWVSLLEPWLKETDDE